MAAQSLTTKLPIQTISESNTSGISKVSGFFKSKRIKQQRSETFYSLLGAWGRHIPSMPLTIILTRISPRQLDTDNLAASLKHIRDGVSDWLCGTYNKGDDRQEGISWEYTQCKGRPYEMAVEITVCYGYKSR